MKATNILLLLYVCFIAGSTLIADMSRRSHTYQQAIHVTRPVKNHDKDINLFTRQSNNEKDSIVKHFVRKTLPGLQTQRDASKPVYSDLHKAIMY